MIPWLPLQWELVQAGTLTLLVSGGRSDSTTCARMPLGSKQVCKEPAGFPDILLRGSRVRMAAVTVHSQLRNLSLGDQHFNYPLPLKKKKKGDTLIYPSDWLDSCQSDNLSLAERDLVLVLRLALCALYGRLAPGNGNTETTASTLISILPQLWPLHSTSHGVTSRASLARSLEVISGNDDFSFSHPWPSSRVDVSGHRWPICTRHARQGCHPPVYLREEHQ